MCVFCSIIKGELPAKKVYEDEHMIVIADIKPAYRLHYLAIPKEHYGTLAELDPFTASDLAFILKKIPDVAKGLGYGDGYRLVINQGESAGQTVAHLHIHILGGEKLRRM